jgi:hypothetical protein
MLRSVRDPVCSLASHCFWLSLPCCLIRHQLQLRQSKTMPWDYLLYTGGTCTSALTTSTMHMKTVLPTLYRSATLLRPLTCSMGTRSAESEFQHMLQGVHPCSSTESGL